MKNKREALIKFLRIKVMPDEDEEEEEKQDIKKLTNMYSGNILQESYKQMSDIEGYNQADMFKKHCDMLISFAQEYK